jgi:hypothetical protein
MNASRHSAASLTCSLCGRGTTRSQHVHTVTPSSAKSVHLGGGDWEDHSSRPALAKKFSRPHFNQWLGMVAPACRPSDAGTHKWKIAIQAGPGIKAKPCITMTNAKRAGDMAQVVECLPSKLKAPSSNPSTAKKKKKVSVYTIFSCHYRSTNCS